MTGDDDTSDGAESNWTMPRRGALGLLGTAGLGAVLAGTASADGNGNQPWHEWDANVNANGHSLTELGALTTAANDAAIADFAGENLDVDDDGVLNAEGSPDSIHVVTDYPGETLDQKLENVLDALPEGDDIPNRQPGHKIVIPAPDPDDPAAADGLPAWRFESPVEIDNNTGKLVFEMGWTLIYATESIESFFVIGPDEKTENINLYGGMFYAQENIERSFIDIQGVGHMHISRMYLQNLAERNSVPAGIRLADYHGSSELTITDTEVTGCRDGFLAEYGSDDVPYGPSFDLDISNWRAGGGEHSIRIDGGASITLDSIQVGGHPLQSVSEDIIRLENSVNETRSVSISNVHERHNAMDYNSGVRVADVTDGEGPRHNGIFVENVDLFHAEYSTDIEYASYFDQQNLRPAPKVRDDAVGSTRWFDSGVQKHETYSSHEFHAGGSPTFTVDEDDVRIDSAGNGAVLTTPDGQSRYRVRVDNDGNLVTEEVEDGGNRTGIIESFEDGDLAEYEGETDAYTIDDSAPVGHGETSLKNTSGDTAIIVSTSGLAQYPQAGDAFAAQAARTETNDNLGIAFGAQDTENFYFARIYPESDGDRLQLYKRVNGDYTELDKANVSVDRNTLYDFVIDWGEFGEIDVEVRDPSGDAIGSVATTDETFTEGGIGVRSTGALDNVRFR
ncbi:hypothetical protein HYG81_23235 (plasmid) [Natrinema zhouii]|uniref:hypothetical protein n=1 Tax=Natrinema zhouii TaxID=1710539 RepID=UPI001CFF9A62|nr:hypothetical protein [Natrinema zhouii]UHQ98495.1 hypothetical protein HYG81_23235 [Natrinema zhouii]